MSAPVLTFFNNKGGVGKTSLVYHVAWMLSELGKRVVVVDLDPQANLTSAFLNEEMLENLWDNEIKKNRNDTIYQCILPLTQVGDLREPKTVQINERLHLVPGDLGLTRFEDALSNAWLEAMGSHNLYRPFRILSAFWQVGQMAAIAHQADIILTDVGPNLGAINRSALIGSDHVVIPLAADLFSLQGLRNLGPTLLDWRSDWTKRVNNWNEPDFDLPAGRMKPEGYVLMQHMEKLSRPVQSYQKWVNRIPLTYQTSVLDRAGTADPADQLAKLKHYRSLAPMAQEVRKPIFHLKPADGAIGSHAASVRDVGIDFKTLTETILSRIQRTQRTQHAEHADKP